MASRAQLLTGVGVGFGLMYLLDPERGARRRARVRDAAVNATHTAADAADTTRRDLTNRIVGAAAELRGRFTGSDDISDGTLIERVRSKLGRVVSHPHAISVTSDNGVITLTGPILQAEVPRLLRTVEAVRGVRDVVNQLEEHKQAGDVPSLQGGSTPPGFRADIFQREWTPATRVLVGAGGAMLAAFGANRRDVPGWLLMAGGLGLLARAGTNLETRRLVGISPLRRPKSGLDADLARMKTCLETGRPPHDAAQPNTTPPAFVP